MINRVFHWTLLLLIVSCVVFPNSLKLASALLLFVASIVGLFRARSSLSPILYYWTAASIVTIAYAYIGINHGAPNEALLQTLFIYIISPLLWILTISAAASIYSTEKIVSALTMAGIAACVSVYVFYYLFLTYGADSVSFFIETANVDISNEGYIAAAMYVFGSLIFIIGGYAASFSAFPRSLKRVAILALFAVTALISGRSALILSLFIGLAINLVYLITKGTTRISISGAVFGLLGLVIGVMAIMASLSMFDLDIQQLIDPLTDKLYRLGGEGRNEQFFALLDSIFESNGMGKGHGIGVAFAVSEEYPWRYEMVWLASIHRVGLVGAAVYASIYIFTLARGARALLTSRITRSDLFLFGAFVCAFIASNTNPYLEAFVFQWMFVLPIVTILKNNHSNNSKKGTPVVNASPTAATA